MKMIKMLLAAGVLAFASVASATTLTIDFGGVYGGTLADDGTGSEGPLADDGIFTTYVTGTDINISTITIQDDDGTVIYDVTGGLLNFDTRGGKGSEGLFDMVITGGVAGLDVAVADGTTLFEGSFTSWDYSDGLIDFFGMATGSGSVGDEVLANTVSIGDNPFAFSGFSLESNNGDVLSTDFLMTAIGERTVVPVPAAAWLFGSGLLGLVGVARRKA